ncbi:Substance-K receptor [Trichoplax sp. H2]|nr:Substance-K receptor [Trichoplax sp. H2]|eukprot:RDD44227.1 Substance-K receptor [Trichoplax sp. H2]
MSTSSNGSINNTLTTLGKEDEIINADELAMRTVFLILAILYVVVMTIAIPGNLLILWITLANRNLQTPINLLVCNLAISGLLIASIRIPIKIYELLHPIQALFHYPFTVSACKMAEIIPGACITSISFTLTAICIDRYNSIVHPTKRKLRINRAQVYVFLPLCWFFAISFWIPYGIFTSVYSFQGFQRCSLNWPLNSHLDIKVTNSDNEIVYYLEFSKMIVWLLFLVLIFLTPAIIMTTLYIITVRKLCQVMPSNDRTITLTNTRSTHGRFERLILNEYGLKIRKRIVKIFVACLVLFMISNLPYYLILVLLDFGLIYVGNFYLLYYVANILILLNYSCVAYNAVIYGYFNHTYRSNAPQWLRYIGRMNSLSRVRSLSFNS